MTSSDSGAHAARAERHHPGRVSDDDRGVDHLGRSSAVNLAVAGERKDQVRWGPVWAGVVVILPTILLLQLGALALGLLDLGSGGSSAGWVSAVIGLVGFLLGGLVAGATAMWRGVGSGLLHGVLVWMVGVVAILLLTLLGGGALLGSLAGVFTEVANVQELSAPDVDTSEALETARSAAGGAALGLLVSLVAAALGGLLGAKMWGKDEDAERTTATTIR